MKEAVGRLIETQEGQYFGNLTILPAKGEPLGEVINTGAYSSKASARQRVRWFRDALKVDHLEWA
jgi:hypothetical protein